MRLKRLSIHGFKSFAPRTDVVFGEGLTAVVGPNGSGKSNVADSIRWVLGEQSLSHLRAKKTEDLVFGGSSKRAPLGMAEVSITIDNSDRLLPLDFGEVTLTRRAYRSGENEYFINRSRVRLRDVLDVAATLGQAYTVVGQGLVDQALSLRPEERRELFEEAAAIRGYFVQREDALRRLTRTEENMARVGDLVTELEPQVRRMERQARQADEYRRLEGELRTLLEEWYGQRWLKATSELERAIANEDEALSVVARGRSELSARSSELAEARARVWKLVDEVSAMHEERATLQARHAAESQAQAVLAERLSAASGQRASLLRERGELQAGAQALREHIAALEKEAESRATEIASEREAERGVAEQLAQIDARALELRAIRQRDAAAVDVLARRLAELASSLTEGRQRRSEQERALAEGETALASLKDRAEHALATLDERRSAHMITQKAVGEAERELSLAQSDLRESTATRAAAEERRREVQREVDSVTAQISALAAEQQSGLYAGVRAVVAAAKAGRVGGFVGTVAELFRVPAQYETAVEAALGARLQEVVMRSWADVEGAIAFLKQTGSGRATFLPLDTLRAPSLTKPPVAEGITGCARDLVEFDPALAAVADSLLGRLLIVADLPAARAAVKTLPSGSPWTLATLAGEVVRPGGSVTGGTTAREEESRSRGKTILGRERKRRDLGASLEQLGAVLAEAKIEVERAAAALGDQEGRVATQAAHLDDARRKQLAAQAAHLDQQALHSRLQQEIAWRAGLVAESRTTLQALADAQAESAGESAAIEQSLDEARQVLAASDELLKAAERERSGVAEAAGASETRLAVLAEGLRNVRTRRSELANQLEGDERRLDELGARIDRASREEHDLVARQEGHAAQARALAAQLAEIEAGMGPAEQRIKDYESEVSALEQLQARLQEALLESETQHSRAAVERQRCIGALDSLRIEVIEELGDDAATSVPGEVAAVGAGASFAGVAPSDDPAWRKWELVWSERAGAAPAPGNGFAGARGEHGDLERRVVSYRARLSRLGPINALAVEEHAALVDRHDYLQTELADLTTASEGLRRVIGELDRAMRDQFAETFERVNEAFQYFFSQLFSGGTARLELTNPEDVATSGVELMAQPPGKRMQHLAALSGGERALTSAALLFALLKVRPVPFCVLDEVDAALDETNVQRFRTALRELGQRTQFVVITHNRGTIEVAETLYGVSMQGDGTSQLLSLKVEG